MNYNGKLSLGIEARFQSSWSFFCRFYRWNASHGCVRGWFERWEYGISISRPDSKWPPILHCDWLISSYSDARNPWCRGKWISHGLSAWNLFIHPSGNHKPASTTQKNCRVPNPDRASTQWNPFINPLGNEAKSTSELQIEISQKPAGESFWKSQGSFLGYVSRAGYTKIRPKSTEEVLPTDCLSESMWWVPRKSVAHSN